MVEPVETCLKNRQWDAAVGLCNAMLIEYPTHVKLNAYAGLALFRKGDFEGAVKYLRRALDLDPSYVDAGLKLVQALDKVHLYREAYETAKELLFFDPNNDQLIGLMEHLRDFDVEEHDGWERTIRLETNITLASHES